jgi:hypothetical protein
MIAGQFNLKQRASLAGTGAIKLSDRWRHVLNAAERP